MADRVYSRETDGIPSFESLLKWFLIIYIVTGTRKFRSRNLSDIIIWMKREIHLARSLNMMDANEKKWSASGEIKL